MAEPPKPWDVATFERLRPELTAFVRGQVVALIEEGAETPPEPVQVVAPVKSGKREMVEYLAARDSSARRIHAFLSSLHRVADETQRLEMRLFGITVIPIGPKGLGELTRWLAHPVDKVLHLDESDYGTGENQSLSSFWKAMKGKTAIVLYSATPEESVWSPIIRSERVAYYTPPPTYCGVSRFLEEGLAAESTPFFEEGEDGEMSLSPQGLGVATDLLEELDIARRADPRGRRTSRNVIIVRLTYQADAKAGKAGRAFYKAVCAIPTIPDLEEFNILVDKAPSDCRPPPDAKNVYVNLVNWSNPQFDSVKPTLVIIDQKCGRSTEWGFHDRLFAYHEYRPKPIYSTVLQATMRVAHYTSRYAGEFQRIRVYTKRSVLEYAAGGVGLAGVVNDGVTFGPRISIASSGVRAAPVAVRFYPANLAAEDLGLSETVATISGSPDLPEEVRNHRFAPNRDKIYKPGEGGKYMGYIRSYRVLELANVRGEGWGLAVAPRLTACYDGDVLGVALRWYGQDGAAEHPRATAKAVKSMYRAPRRTHHRAADCRR